MNNLQFLAVDQGADLERDKFSGIMGLSPSKVAAAKGMSGFLNQISTFKVIDPIFSFYMTKNGAPGSILTFGGYDEKKYSLGEIKWIDID